TVGDYTIGKIFIHADTRFPAPCPPDGRLGGVDATRIDIEWSVDNGATWFPVPLPQGTGTTADVLIDPLALGVSGYALVWRATLLTDVLGCEPELSDVAIGYEGFYKGVYQTTEAIPAGNVMLRSSYELPASTWPDRTPRGHLVAKVLYSLDTVPLTDY